MLESDSFLAIACSLDGKYLVYVTLTGEIAIYKLNGSLIRLFTSKDLGTGNSAKVVLYSIELERILSVTFTQDSKDL